MDVLAQTKLTASEWESIEIPISNSELKIMEMIQDCYPREYINKITNNHLNMIRFTKIEPNPEIHAFLLECVVLLRKCLWPTLAKDDSEVVFFDLLIKITNLNEKSTNLESPKVP